MKQRILKITYIILFWCICLFPLAAMPFGMQTESSENRSLSQLPELRGEKGWNPYWLSQMGDYFQDHFAFRSYLVTVNALLRGRLLGTSSAEGVIQGNDHWLYYADSLDDYLGENLLSDRSLFNIAHSLAILQQRLSAENVRFVFTIAPNKNSLYGNHMPYYDRVKVSDEKNLFRLKEYLKKEQVTYADLYERLLEEADILYHQRDSHWNNRGAAVAADLLLQELEREEQPYFQEDYTVRRDFEGDLDKMLYPEAVTPEEECYYDRQWDYQYVTETDSNFDPKIETYTEGKTGSLVMFRDSFTNALLPFMAEAFETAYFSRGVPYQISEAEKRMADAVVIERAERFLPDMALNPPVMEAPAFRMAGEAEVLSDRAADHLTVINQGILKQISGHLEEKYLDTDTRIFASINQGEFLYEAFPMDIRLEEETSDGGFCLYLGQNALSDGENYITIYILSGKKLQIVSENLIQEE